MRFAIIWTRRTPAGRVITDVIWHVTARSAKAALAEAEKIVPRSAGPLEAEEEK